MEFRGPHENTGRHGAAGEGFAVGVAKSSTQVLKRSPEHDFECTYFRQRSKRIHTAASNSGGLHPVAICKIYEQSDEYTDSDSEPDNSSNVERWLESLPTNGFEESSAPNSVALDRSRGPENVDEINEDSTKDREDDLETFSSITDNSRISLRSRTEDPKLQKPGGTLEKHSFINLDESPAMTDWLVQRAPSHKVGKTLRMRRKVPLNTEVEAEETRHSTAKGKGDENISANLLLSEIRCEDKLKPRSWSKLSFEEEDHDKVRLEIVHGTEKSTLCKIVRKSEIEWPSDDAKDSEKLRSSNSLFRVGIKLKTIPCLTFKTPCSKIVETESGGAQWSRPKQVRTTWRNRNQKRGKRILRGLKNTSGGDRQQKSLLKTREVVQKNHRLFENMVQIGNITNPVRPPKNLRVVRFQDEVAFRTSSEVWKQAKMLKVARNKRILQTVKQIVNNIRTEEQSLKSAPRDALDLRGMSDEWKKDRKRSISSIESKTIERRKPKFTNPVVEKCLDMAMDVALDRYKCSRNTWESYIKEKSRKNTSSTAYESPPAKKPKPQQDFSLPQTSWQPIYNYFSSSPSYK